MTDTGYAAARWTFDDEVTRVFDDMLARSIPHYSTMRDLTTRVALDFLTPGSTIVDLGTSRGEALARLRPDTRPANAFVGIEVAAPMRAAARERFADVPNVSILDVDLRDRAATRDALGHPRLPASVVLSVLTLQFVPIEHRAAIVEDVFHALDGGGVFVLVEKVLGSSARTSRLFVDTYHEGKVAAGYTTEDVARKALALEGVLVAQTAHANEELLRSAGFADVECYWRWCNFAAWLAVKRS